MNNLIENGISPKAVDEFIKEIKNKNIDMHSFNIYRNGKEIFSLYGYPFDGESMHRMYSSGKMLVALAIIKAVDDKLITLNDKVVNFFENELPPDIDSKYQYLNIKHMLTMNTGHRYDTMMPMRESDNWVKGFFSQPLNEMPGTLFFYNGGVPYILTKIIRKVTGMDYIDYLNIKFFDDMDVKIVADKVQGDDSDPSGVSIRIKDFEKLAILLLNQGSWNGKQLIEKSLINEMGKYHTSSIQVDEIPNVNLDTKYGYGYFLWRNSVGGYRLDGGRGQYGLVFPDLDMCVSIMSAEEDQGLILELFWDKVYPYIWSCQASEKTNVNEIEKYKALPEWNYIHSDMEDVNDCFYIFDKNEIGIEKVEFEVDEAAIKVKITQNEKEIEIEAGADGKERINREIIDIPEKNWFMNHVSGNHDHNYYIVGRYIIAPDFMHKKEITLFVRSMDLATYTILSFRIANNAIRMEVANGAWNCVKMRGRLEILPHIISPIIICGKVVKKWSQSEKK